MDDVFPREAAAAPEPFTGERLTAALTGQTPIEHYHRYLLARSLCHGLDVLDVASGEGYGSAQIAQVARSVIGVEYAAATVRSAIANFPRPNLRFAQGDARALPLPDACVDMVVSFETIEHFDRQDDFLAEVRRVLRPDGRFIVSTPDRDIYSPPGAPPNPFHVRELTREEFVTLLRRYFDHVEIQSQRPILGSALLGDAASPSPPMVFERRDATHFEAGPGLRRAPYVVALAANQPLRPLVPSLYIERSDLDTEMAALVARTRELQQAHEIVQRARHDAEQARLEADQARSAAEQCRVAAERAAMDAATRIAVLERDLDTVRGSLSTFARGYLPRLRRHLFG
jgi:SAM-dependent methyltransferase